ncbi:hypothetical protein ACWEWX_49500 [Streptomyces asiaticus]
MAKYKTGPLLTKLRLDRFYQMQVTRLPRDRTLPCGVDAEGPGQGVGYWISAHRVVPPW